MSKPECGLGSTYELLHAAARLHQHGGAWQKSRIASVYSPAMRRRKKSILACVSFVEGVECSARQRSATHGGRVETSSGRKVRPPRNHDLRKPTAFFVVRGRGQPLTAETTTRRPHDLATVRFAYTAAECQSLPTPAGGWLSGGGGWQLGCGSCPTCGTPAAVDPLNYAHRRRRRITRDL